MQGVLPVVALIVNRSEAYSMDIGKLWLTEEDCSDTRDQFLLYYGSRVREKGVKKDFVFFSMQHLEEYMLDLLHILNDKKNI